MPFNERYAIRSGELRDFISRRPGFLIRRGIPLFFLLLTGLAVGSYFVRYPDIIHARAKVNAVNGPKQVIAKNGGRLVKLFKGDNWEIRKGEIIGYMESTASHEEVIRLSIILDTLQFFADSNRLEEIPRFWKSTNQSFGQLGELQQAHQTFIQGFIAFKDYLSAGFYVAKKQMLYGDLANTRRLLHTLYEQKALQQQDLAISQKNYDVHDTLHNEALITDFEYRNQKSQLINKKMSIPQISASIINNQGQQNALLKEMMELENQIIQQRSIFVQQLNAYRSLVEDWKQKYLITAPVSGKFLHAGFIDENQHLQANQTIGFITNDNNQYFIEMLIPQTNFGKVKPGQDVLLKFSSYPAQEFGSVKGRIDYIKYILSDSGYLSRVSLPERLITNYRKPISFKEGMTAEAEIITEERRLSERFFGEIRSLLK